MAPARYRSFLVGAPRTLLWRIFLVVTFLMLASVATWSAIFNHFDVASRAGQMAQTVVSIINLTRTALLNADPALRKDLLLDLATLEGIRIYPAEKQDRTAPLEDSALMQMLTTEVRQQLGPETRFASSWEGLAGFWVSFRIQADDPEDAGEFWVMLPVERVMRPHTREWIGWGAAALCLALLGAYVIVSRLSRPLKDLTVAARTVGRGEIPARLDEDGPTELSELAHAFNQMSRDLQELDADRALILAGVSHDLRTPLARLRLGVEMCGADAADVDAMVSDIEDMDRIIGQFLSFSRESGDEILTPLDLTGMAEELAALYTRRGFPLTLHTRGIAIAEARPQALRRAVTNLIENALRYAGHPPELEVGMVDGRPAIEVLDRGPGIPPADAERVKRPFTRLESARSNTKGSGLGLAIVDRIVRGQQGEFRLAPREGGGLRASIILRSAPRA
ncbi:ATP-binding protein [Zoogloea dura]|uniref:histidine kinase n=1 Tax=Zoogloea dura TaxID=2728840 RepID=A0A848G097_9RHOO|nr:ATP-binding protein [Zoogloea dura]NML24682.1 HAMP domain-containing protein [Zoogloea dura]